VEWGAGQEGARKQRPEREAVVWHSCWCSWAASAEWAGPLSFREAEVVEEEELCAIRQLDLSGQAVNLCKWRLGWLRQGRRLEPPPEPALVEQPVLAQPPVLATCALSA